MKNLPKTLWVVRENTGKDEYLIATEYISEIDDGAIVGEYTLTSLNTKRVTHELDTNTKKKIAKE